MSNLLKQFISAMTLTIFLVNGVAINHVYAGPSEDLSDLITPDPSLLVTEQSSLPLPEDARNYVENYNSQLQRLSDTLSGRGSNVHELDPFLILRQTPNPDEVDKVKAYIDQKNKLDRLQVYLEKIKSDEALSEEDLLKDLEAKTLAELQKSASTLALKNECIQRAQQYIEDQANIVNNLFATVDDELKLMEYEEKLQVYEEIRQARRTGKLGELKKGVLHYQALALSEEALSDKLLDMREAVPVLKEKVSKKKTAEANSIGDKIRISKLRIDLIEGGNKGFVLAQDGANLNRFDIPIHSAHILGNYLVIFAKEQYSSIENKQNVLFVDLKYFRAALGRKIHVPIFRLPIEAYRELTSLRDVSKLNIDTLEQVGNLHVLAWNVLVNLLDLKTYNTAAPLVDSLSGVFDNAIKMAMDFQNNVVSNQDTVKVDEDVLKNIGDSLTQQLNFIKNDQQTQSQLSNEAKKTISNLGEAEVRSLAMKTFNENYLYQGKMMGMVKSNAANQKEQQKLAARIRILWTLATNHRPLGSPTILQSLAMMAAGVARPVGKILGYRTSDRTYSSFKDGAYHLTRHPYIRLGGAVVAAAVIGEMVNPEAVNQMLYCALDVASTGLDMILGKMKDVAYVANEAWHTSFKGFNPMLFKQAYLDDPTTRAHFFVGLQAIFCTVFLITAIPHILINTVLLIKDFSAADLRQYEQKLEELEGKRPGKLSVYKAWFIDREQKAKSAYLQLMGMAINKRNSELADKEKLIFTPEDEREVDAFLAMKAEEESKTLLGRMYTKVKSAPFLGKFFNGSFEIQSFGAAFRHFLVSWSSLTNTEKAYTTFWWEGYFVFRAYCVRPILMFNTILFPKYYSVAMKNHNQNRINPPTKLNGGRENIVELARRVLVRVGSKVTSYLPINPLSVYLEDQKQTLDDLNKWEEKVLMVEEALQPIILKKSTEALIKHISETDPLGEEVAAITANGGISSVTDTKSFSKGDSRSFFVNYFDTLMEESLKVVLEQIAYHEGELSESIPTLDQSIEEGIQSLESVLSQNQLSQEERENLEERLQNLQSEKSKTMQIVMAQAHGASEIENDNGKNLAENRKRLEEIEKEINEIKKQLNAERKIVEAKSRLTSNQIEIAERTLSQNNDQRIQLQALLKEKEEEKRQLESQLLPFSMLFGSPLSEREKNDLKNQINLLNAEILSLEKKVSEIEGILTTEENLSGPQHSRVQSAASLNAKITELKNKRDTMQAQLQLTAKDLENPLTPFNINKQRQILLRNLNRDIASLKENLSKLEQHIEMLTTQLAEDKEYEARSKEIIRMEERLEKLNGIKAGYQKDILGHSSYDFKGNPSLISFLDRLGTEEEQKKDLKESVELAVKQALGRRSIYEEVKERVSKRIDYQKLSTDMKYRILTAMDPVGGGNRQIARVMAVRRQMEKPEAMGRAVRGMMAATIVDDPLKLLLHFVCMAGLMMAVDQPLLKPIQDMEFGENAWFYLSRYSMVYGYIVGVVTGILADTGIKLMQDELHDADFGSVPEGRDAHKSFLSYYFKQLRASNNTLWQNQWHNMKIIFANMVPAFINILFLQLISQGQFRTNAYVIGYLFAYFVPLSGLSNKIEQAFELAVGWYLKDVREHLRAHPKIQEWYMRQSTWGRLKFNVFCKIYQETVGSITENLELMNTEKLGSYSLLRVLFAGKTPEEILGHVAAYLKSTGSVIPGLSIVLEKIGSIFWRSGQQHLEEDIHRGPEARH